VHSELTFIEKLLRSEYHFIVEEERHPRQAFGQVIGDIFDRPSSPKPTKPESGHADWLSNWYDRQEQSSSKRNH